MEITLQNDLPRSYLPQEFLDPEFVITLKEISSIIHQCEGWSRLPDNRECFRDDDVCLHNVILRIIEEEFQVYSICLSFDFGNTELNGILEAKIETFEEVVTTLKLILANMKAIESAEKNVTLSSRDRAVMILRNFSHYLHTVITLQDRHYEDACILCIKDADNYVSKLPIPDWISRAFKVSYTGFGYGNDKEDLKDKTIKERYFQFISELHN